MVYPKLVNKHKEDAFFHPGKFKKGERPKDFPKKFILVYYVELLNYFKKKYHPKKYKINELLTVYQYKDIGFVKVPGVGSPIAVLIMETLIAKGGKVFLSLGTAGGLKNRGIYLCNRALRDEGTSYHYIPHGHYSYPDEKLTNKLGKSIKKIGLEYEFGTTWTIDAIYRETIREVEKYVKQGIATIEMEASALFAVAKYRKVKIASAFVVSDTLIKKEHVKFYKKQDFKQQVRKLVDIGIECLK